MSEEQLPKLERPFPRAIQPFSVAMVIDGIVYQVFHCDGQEAAQYLSDPEFIQISYGDAEVGWEYKDGKFFYPEHEEPYQTRGL
jgi:hypothetical protein